MRSPADVLYNFHWIVRGRAARASQAYLGFLGPFLRAHGIRAVINLRGPNPAWRWWRNETRICASLGTQHIDVMLSSKRLPTRKMLLALLDAFDTARSPMLMKCSGGQDRTSLAAALYLLHTKGWRAMAEAKAQFARWPYLHLPRRNQRWLARFPEFAQERASGTSLRTWLSESYTPEDFKAWLEARGEGASFVGLYDPALGL